MRFTVGVKPGRLSRVFLMLIFLFVLFLSLLWGRYPRPGFADLRVLLNDEMAKNLLWNIRVPRILMAVMAGATLAGTGHVLQTVLGNPLVEPGLLGVSQGAAFGAALALLLGAAVSWPVFLSASFFGLAGFFFSWFLAKKIRYGGGILRLVLAGIVVSALFSSGLGILKYLADPRNELPEIVFWLMGGLSFASWDSVMRSAVPVLVSMSLMSAVRWRINLLALEDCSAFALGTHPGRERIIIITLSVIAVASITAMAGIISWVGLLIPHLARKLVGADTLHSLPLSMLIGSLFLLVCDDIARGMLIGEIPLGLISTLGGSIMFGFLMTFRDRRMKH